MIQRFSVVPVAGVADHRPDPLEPDAPERRLPPLPPGPQEPDEPPDPHPERRR